MGCGASAEVLAAAPVSNNPDEFFPYEGSGPWHTCKPDGLILPRLAKSGAASAADCPPQTLQMLLKKAAEEKGDKPALKAEKPCPELQNPPPPALPEAQWTTWTYKQYYEDSRKAAKAFVKLGFEPFDTVAIWGFNAPEWMLSALAAGFAGGKVGGLYPTDTPETAAFKVVHSGASVVVVEDKAKLDRLLPALAARQDPSPSKVKAFVAYGYEPAPGETVEVPKSGLQAPVLSWSALMNFGAAEADDVIEARSKAVQPGHCAVLVYTSGTTGEPKAVMLSHDCMLFEALTFVNVAKAHVGLCAAAEQERILSYLPLSHVAGKMVDVCFPFVATAMTTAWVTAYFARPYDLKAGTLKDRLNVARPTVFLGVPLVWEKIADRLRAVGASTKGLKKKLSTWAKAKGLQHSKVERKTADTIDSEGWLHSGDKGMITKTGMVKITGRYKELIIGEGGENIAPVPIEDHIKGCCDGINEVMLIGDKRKYNVALITLKAVGANGETPGTDDLDAGAARVNPQVTKISQAMDDRFWIEQISLALASANNNGKVCPNNAFKVQKFMILPHNFSEEEGFLTPTKKLKRPVVEKAFAKQIDSMYASTSTYVRYAP